LKEWSSKKRKFCSYLSQALRLVKENKSMRKLAILPALVFLLTSISHFLFGQQIEEDSTRTFFQLLIEDEIMELTLEANFDSLFENKKQNIEYGAKISLPSNKDSIQSLQLKIRPRGVFRRRYCDSPPLRLNFHKKDLNRLGLSGEFDKLKLVTPCVNDVAGDQVLLREYWTYRLYNEITPNSFKVHLLKINYVNTQSPDTIQERIGFLIENTKELAHRIGGELIDSFGLQVNGVNKLAYQNMTLFNYMIGNLDWKLSTQRNMKLVNHPKEGIITVPYDFDMSAMVWPSYARLNPDYGQKGFQERFCLGQFESKESLHISLEIFKNMKTACKEGIQVCPFLNSMSKRDMLSYLNSFYFILKKDKRIQKAFYGHIVE